MKAIVTIPPYAPFIKEVAKHPIVSGVRLNTVMPIKQGTLEETLKRIQVEIKDKDLWIDLKCRQLRVVGYWSPPFTEVTLSHTIEVDTPVTAYFRDGIERATVLEVDGNKLIMQDGPRRIIGPGESVNIIHPSLKIDGYFTDTDLKYIETAKDLGIKTLMLSFVEGAEDKGALQQIYPDAIIVEKIESQKGMDYVRERWKSDRLMAARGDLYIEVNRPHEIINAVETIVNKDPQAIAASRIFPSLAQSGEPTSQDIGDVDSLMRMGYRTFMFGDEICMGRESILAGLNLLEAMAEEYVAHH